jgi:hypothetical protein
MPDAIATQGFTLKIGDVGDSPASLTDILGITNFQGFDGQAAEIDVTHLQSTAKEFIMGLQDFGTFSIDVNYLPDNPGQLECRTAKASGTLKAFKATFSDLSTADFEAYVLSSPVSGGVDAKVDSSFALRITGDVTFA